CGAVIAQRAIARDEQIHTRVEQITRIPTGRKLENDGVALRAVRPNLLRRRGAARCPEAPRADRPACVRRRLRDREAAITEHDRNVVRFLRQRDGDSAGVGGGGGALSVYPIPPLPNTTSCAVTGAPSQNCAP